MRRFNEGPTEQLYLAGAPLVAFGGLPIVRRAPTARLRQHQHRAVHRHRRGTEAVRTSRLARLMQQAFTELKPKPAQQVNIEVENPMKNIGWMLR